MSKLDSLPAEDKIARAKAQLSREHAFYGAHALAMQFVESEQIPTMATNYFQCLWNRSFVDRLTVEEIKGVIVHEVLHRIFLHPFRIRGRMLELANIAMDFSINPFILEAGLTLPSDVLNDKKYHGRTWEQIYQMLFQEGEKNGKGKDKKPQSWGQVMEPTGEKGEKLSESEARAMEIDAESTNRAMLQTAKMAGQIPGNLAEIIDKMFEPDIDYDEIITQVFSGAKPSGYSMKRPNKSALHNFDIFASGRNYSGSGTVGIGFDTSGSITSVEAGNVLGIINNVMESTRPDKVVVVQFDHAVQHVDWHDSSDQIPEIQIHGRGGTSFCPQFEYIQDHDIKIDQYLVVTDGYGDFPENPPPFPVTWLMTTDEVAPWGRTVRFKVKSA